MRGESTADEIIEKLRLEQHPEGGWYRQVWVDEQVTAEGRAFGTSILFLLRDGERSHWHRIDATEIWHFHAGAPLVLSVAADEAGPAIERRLGPDVLAGELPQAIVPVMHWQAARSLGAFSLVGCTVSPGFRFEGFELAAPDFDIIK
ncbi:cupin domain-containing protein [Pelagibacterium limicola]|uniref:cupin domain-containing protein n=1 Tax=Pelagibacterium limicola TaxID=2791022 RepID=UPI0018AFDF12|nr:cupin domain-containing protein [Pelagibacterium limicola]